MWRKPLESMLLIATQGCTKPCSRSPLANASAAPPQARMAASWVLLGGARWGPAPDSSGVCMGHRHPDDSYRFGSQAESVIEWDSILDASPRSTLPTPGGRSPLGGRRPGRVLESAMYRGYIEDVTGSRRPRSWQVNHKFRTKRPHRGAAELKMPF